MSPDFDVVVIGGGFCGTLVAANLLRGAERPLSLAIVERALPLGRGAAYSTRDPAHLLNVPAGNMSADPDQPDHFRLWAGVPPSSFVPRRLYAEYLAAVLKDASASARDGVRLSEIGDEAVTLRPESGRARVELRSGRVLAARRVVLALGNMPPADPAGADGRRYVGDPWLPNALDAIAPDDDVLLIGSGLTAADVASALRGRGHRGFVRIVSRRGSLPLEHAPARPRPPLAVAGPRTVRAVMRLLRREAAAADRSGEGWRAVVDSLRPQIPALWTSFDEAERRRFLRHARHYWDLHRHRLPPETARALRELRASGRLSVVAGRVESVGGRDGRVAARVRLRASGGIEEISIDRAINCTGPADPCRTADPLVSDMLRRGLVRADGLGLGLDAAPDGALLDRGGSPSETLWTLGPPLKGVLWESTAVPELRVQARDLSRRLLRALAR